MFYGIGVNVLYGLLIKINNTENYIYKTWKILVDNLYNQKLNGLIYVGWIQDLMGGGLRKFKISVQ